MQSTLTSKGQATISKAVREHLNLKAGDEVRFFIQPDGRVVLLPTLSAESAYGVLDKPGRRPATIDDMDAAIADGATERFRSSARTATPPSKSSLKP